MTRIPPFLYPDITNGIKCVYKLVFTDGYYYIGSTGNLKKRVSTHLSVLKMAGDALLNCSYRWMKGKSIEYVEIIEVSEKLPELRLRESREIKISKGDPKLLNKKRMGMNYSEYQAEREKIKAM